MRGFRAWRGRRDSVEGAPRDTLGEGRPEQDSAAAAPRQATASSTEGRREAPAGPPPSRRRAVGRGTRDVGAAAVGALGSGVILLARLVMALATLIALLIGLAIVLRDVDANASNTIVKGIHEGANFFAGAFTGLFTFNGHPKRAITVDWGIALIAYLIVGALIAGFIARVGRSGLLFGRSHRTAPSH